LHLRPQPPTLARNCCRCTPPLPGPTGYCQIDLHHLVMCGRATASLELLATCKEFAAESPWPLLRMPKRLAPIWRSLASCNRAFRRSAMPAA
jgi:hypothetical protein